MNSRLETQQSVLPIVNPQPLRSIFAVTLIAMLGFTAIGTANAEEYRSRADRWEFTTALRYVDGKSTTYNGGSQINTNAEVGFGFGFGYNMSNNLAMNFDIGWNSPSFDATIVKDDLTTTRRTGEMSTSAMQLNLLYNFINGPVSPYVSGGLGSTYVDTNVPSSSGNVSCWWDPWYGYICYDYQPTYSDWRFTYNAAAGVRWDMKRDIFLRAAIGKSWIDMPNGGDQDITNGRLEIGFSY